MHICFQDMLCSHTQSECVKKKASCVTKAIQSWYERMAEKAISVLHPLMFAKQMKMSLWRERVDWNKSFDSKKDGAELKGRNLRVAIMEISIGWKAIGCKMIWSQIIAFWSPEQLLCLLLWHKLESLLAPARSNMYATQNLTIAGQHRPSEQHCHIIANYFPGVAYVWGEAERKMTSVISLSALLLMVD